VPGLDANRLADALRHESFVRRLVVFPTTGSTNDDARRLASEGAPEGTVVLAEHQTEGRGRLGRSWDSADGKGLYLSVLLRPTEPPGDIGRYPIAAAVAVGRACRAFAGESVVLKWPNDVLAHGGKLAGVLCELRQSAAGAELVLGIGVNVNQSVEDFATSLRGTATSLRMLRKGVGLDREAVATALLQELGATVSRLRAGAWGEVAEQFLRYAPHATGRRVRLAAGGEGSTDGLDASGALRVATANGIVLVHASESVALAEE
jgi:BirA family transcriptional regulator, biotin operon repressor / biotin---[acetyl-CoA-carboxylase] ligase